ncbi:GNAT family N-acetyltransferase [Liquorilactobacillus capillatus]|uniref:N-acetyltransferase domain-containing protein n=1 Tax=Liquorilactobacillus capillatus DSM 19910 TaxID=1423731 RepID=A0A0R1M0K1_9LACO|nr:GNAT family N-acetyltransferase [Liquorilactobacillus capillatus]KRL01137.1 hypothetical protein FC81_GL001276 [Liquorilactobacillus capillatus DSM 19910]
MKLIEYNTSFATQIAEYKVSSTAFTGLPQTAIKISANNKDYHSLLLVNEQGEIPTFLVLDAGETKYNYTNNKNSLLLRNFSTDQRFLRRNYAKTALTMLPSYVKANFPNIHSIILGVNSRNIPAQKLYEKSGFRKKKKVYQGKKGPQLIYSLALN